jgi:hypothetical protein
MYDAGTRITKYFQSYILQINWQIASCNICKILDFFVWNLAMVIVT